ncbi:MBL fold metallo-hydrolase RNA specificity domain-containing protein [Polynucleobacter necessarius]|uniref:MBL fold metallo-hydrolase RNA specificity domain-containing protein n=1 Tax=Polynucleobacter necessarius TaxID=576610 RepID=UPI0039E47FF3
MAALEDVWWKVQKVRLFGEEVAVKAAIHTIGGLSVHADQAGLFDWLRGFEQTPKTVFVGHGEPESHLPFLRNPVGMNCIGALSSFLSDYTHISVSDSATLAP